MMDIPENATKIDIGLIYPCGCSEKEQHMVTQLLTKQGEDAPVKRVICLKHGKYCDVPLSPME